MTPIEINRRLALAIGYAPEAVSSRKDGTVVNTDKDWLDRPVEYWSRFDHQDWHTIGPIMERYRVIPYWNHTFEDFAFWLKDFSIVKDDDLRTCAALAVIEARERGLLK